LHLTFLGVGNKHCFLIYCSNHTPIRIADPYVFLQEFEIDYTFFSEIECCRSVAKNDVVLVQ